ncbi:MAG: hypothetical protein JWM78_2116 [Verrucomicrobiaceae bacterium]|nr:hypothetical protein [Verrucomicrobiaceae bacterium]
MQDLTLNILGVPFANRDLSVDVLDPVSQNVVRTVTPFLDGTVRIPKIDAGSYEIAIRHPNLALPIIRRPIRVLPIGPTNISVVIDPSKFRNTPIEDIPDANLAPVQELAQSVAETVLPLSNKLPGEAILSQDWNAMAGAIRDLAGALGQLTQLVSPVGHNHPELEKKFDEVSGNFNQLINSVSASLTELQRQFQTQRIRQQISDVLDTAAIDPASPKGLEFTDLVKHLETNVTASPTIFGREVRNTAVQLSTKLEALMDERAADPNFATADSVKGLSTSIDLAKQQRTTTYGAELEHQRKVDRSIGGAVLTR